MADTTARHSLPFPEGTDFVKLGPEDIQALAEALDTKIAAYDQGLLEDLPAPGVSGRRYFATDAVAEYLDTGSGWVRTGLEAGTIVPTFRSVAPAGYLMCDGSPISATGETAELRAAIGSTLPDLRGRVPVGADGAAGRLAANDALGNAGGAEKHLLASAESGMPAHGHGDTLAVAAGGGHSHGPSAVAWHWPIQDRPGVSLVDVVNGVGSKVFAPTAGALVNTTAATDPEPGHVHGVTGGVSNAPGVGASTPHNNMPPYQIVNWIVKT